ncbi:retrovirus-related pol polyprotein from transposon TNT 1-94 [Tanacetum coccineum]
MATMAENVIAAGSETHTNGVTDIRHAQRLKDLAGDDKLRYDSDIKAVNILILGFLVDIYTLINHYQTAKEIWDRFKELIEGTEMTKQERESMLYDELDKFTYDPRESIHSYYLRFDKLINDINMIPMSMTPMQISTKFINHLQPEWSRFVTVAKQARNLHSVTFDQLYAFLKHNERDAKESPPLQSYEPTVVQQPSTFQPDTGLAIPTFIPTYDPIASLNKAMIFLSLVYRRQSQGYAGNARNNQALGARVINIVGNAGANQPRVIRCYDCNGESHMAKQCIIKKRVKDFEWFKEKMLLAQVQEAEVVLDEEQQDFLADSFKETDDCEDLQLQATTNFKAYHVDAYDSGCDDEASANTIFMANLSPICSLNDDTVAPRYDSDTLSEVPHYDTYHDFDVLNYNIQELRYIKNIVSNNESYDELQGNKDVISYTDCMLTIGNDEDNYVPPHVQNNDMILSVIEQMKSQVAKCNTVNQEAKSVNESLTSELEGYKDRVKVLEYAVKDGHSEQEAYLSQQLYWLSEVKKFNDGTLVKIQENLIDMLTKNKLGSCNKRLKGRDWTDYDVKSSREMLKKIDEIPRQLRRLEEYVGGRPKTVNPCTFVRPL